MKDNEPTLVEYARQHAEKMKKECPVVDERWYVIEVTPEYEESGYYGETVPARAVRQTPDFRGYAAAAAWIDTHSPDVGKHFEVRHENKRQFTEERWVNW